MAFRKRTHAIPDHHATIPALFVHVSAMPVTSNLMHQNPQCLCSSSSSVFPEWRVATQRRHSYVCFCRSSEIALRGARCGMGRSCCSYPNVCSSHNIRMWERDRKNNNMETWVLCSNTSGYQSCFCSPLWTTRLRSQSDLWMRSAYEPDCCFCCFPLPCACFFFVLLFKCCETDAEVSASKCCSVMGWACSAFGCRLRLQSPSGPAGENVTSTPPPVMLLHCLISPLEKKKKRKPFSSSKQFSPSGCHGDPLVLSVQVLPVYHNRVLTCVLPWGSRVFVQACACPSDIWLCFNTVHELIFCGTWPAWIHFVYICTLILFTV